MAHCKSCEGIIGVDCSNPSECEYIVHLQELEEQDRQFNPQSPSQIYLLEGYIDALEAEKAELLSVLKQALEALGGNDPQDLNFDDAVCGLIRQAIAKAEGKFEE
jgi:hypothetical protein